VVYLSVVIKAVAAESPSDVSNAAAASAAGSELVVELEMDELNRHECMSALISVLHHMQLKAVTPTVQQVTVYVLYLNLYVYLQDAVLFQGVPRDASVNFGTYQSFQRHWAVFTAITTLSN